MISAFILDVTQRYRRFGTTYRSSWAAWPLKMGLIGSSETSVTNYQSALRKIPEERVCQLLYISVVFANFFCAVGCVFSDVSGEHVPSS